MDNIKIRISSETFATLKPFLYEMADLYDTIGLSLPKIRSVPNLIYLGILKYYLLSRDFQHEAPKKSLAID